RSETGIVASCQLPASSFQNLEGPTCAGPFYCVLLIGELPESLLDTPTYNLSTKARSSGVHGVRRTAAGSQTAFLQTATSESRPAAFRTANSEHRIANSEQQCFQPPVIQSSNECATCTTRGGARRSAIS